MDVKSIEEVQNVYYRMKAEHMSATHVMCGFRIFGSRFHELQNAQDDGEHGGGRCILDVLKEQKIWNVAVFVARYHNGPRLGGQRFEIITEMTKEVIASCPKALNYGRHFVDKTTLKALNEASTKPIPRAERSGPENRGQARGGCGRGRGTNRTPRAGSY